MSKLPFGEIFGYPADNFSEAALAARKNNWCPFQGRACTKDKKDQPLGVCSLRDADSAVTICPNRFLESRRMFSDAAEIAFGKNENISVCSETRILRDRTNVKLKLGKVDFILGLQGQNQQCIDFAALEVQSVYISGGSIRPAFNEFLSSGKLPPSARSRPDFRSSGQKRLMPQLDLKVPVFRRWGKKFFVATDSIFFNQLPTFRRVDSVANSEVTWLVYPFKLDNEDNTFSMGSPQVVFSEWSDVKAALREGIAPEPEEILESISSRKDAFFVRT